LKDFGGRKKVLFKGKKTEYVGAQISILVFLNL